jgi:hypothetical protein
MKEKSQLTANRYSMKSADRTDMLRKLALYWDGQWFLKVVEEFGLDTGIMLNAQVRASFGYIELRTLLKAVRKKRADDLVDAIHLIETYLGVFVGNRLRAKFDLVSEVEATLVVSRCPAFEGAKRAKLDRIDQACAACEGLWPAWMNALMPDCVVDTHFSMQMGRGDPRCHLTIRTEA